VVDLNVNNDYMEKIIAVEEYVLFIENEIMAGIKEKAFSFDGFLNNEKQIDNFLKLFVSNIKEQAYSNYEKYITGNRKQFELQKDELEKLYFRTLTKILSKHPKLCDIDENTIETDLNIFNKITFKPGSEVGYIEIYFDGELHSIQHYEFN